MLKQRLLMASSYNNTPHPGLNGKYFSCGSNSQYTTGQGTNVGNTQVMTQSGSVTTWTKLESAYFCTIGLRDDGTLWSVGLNSAGPTGQGTATGATTALTQIGVSTDWAKVWATDAAALAIKKNGTLWAWGNNIDYGTGLNTSTGFTTTPTQVGSATNWVMAAPGSSVGAGIKSDGTLWSWGNNAQGNTGQATTSGNTTIPTQVGTDTDWKYVSCGYDGMHAIKNNGTLWACGYGPSIGFGPTATFYSTLTQVGTDTNWLMTSTGYGAFFALKTNGTLYSCGKNTAGVTGQGTSSGYTDFLTQIGTDTDWVYCQISGGGFANLQGIARKSNGQIWGWGFNTVYQLGLNNTTNQLSPVQIGVNTDWIQVSTGPSHSSGVRDF